MLLEIMDLGMAVVAGSDTIGRAGLIDLFKFALAIITARLRKTGLQKSAAAAAAVIVGAVGGHIDIILFTHNGPDNKSQIFSHRITQRFADELTGVLDRKFDPQFFVPVRIDL
jgi:hypothetical protein